MVHQRIWMVHQLRRERLQMEIAPCLRDQESGQMHWGCHYVWFAKMWVSQRHHLNARLTCVQAQRMEVLEKSQGWKEPDFDTVLQYLRTVLLRREYFGMSMAQYSKLTLDRWCIAHLHLPKHALSAPLSYPLNARHHLSPQAQSSQTQRHRPR